MMKQKFVYVAILFTVLASCNDVWDNHYSDYPETVNQNMWDAMANEPVIADFYNMLKELRYDTLFLSDIPYTLFIPTNEALARYKNENSIDKDFINYHIASHFIQSGNIVGTRQFQTYSKKFALFERSGTGLKLDGISIISESPLYKNGKFFIIDQVAQPRPNLYEFFAVNNPMLKEYIDSKDSIIVDRERSEPIGFDEQGRTIYDTISIRFNKFEDEFFPVRTEFRNQAATIVFPLKDDYDRALTNMAIKLNAPGYIDYRDIPDKWQQEILIPVLLKHGVFENRLEVEEFVMKPPINPVPNPILTRFKLKNIQGDSVYIDYTPVDKAYCSNGYAYSYDNFEVPDSLYLGNARFEGEWLLNLTGVNRFAWREDVKVNSDIFFNPSKSRNPAASNDSILSVPFPKGYNGRFSLEFSVPHIFPRKYLMVVRTHMDVGGVYDIYVNDVLAKEGFNYVEYRRQRGIIFSVTGARYVPEGRYNSFDMYVDNIHTYGEAKIRFEYKGPGTSVPDNGLVIDYIDLIPVSAN